MNSRRGDHTPSTSHNGSGEDQFDTCTRKEFKRQSNEWNGSPHTTTLLLRAMAANNKPKS